MKSSFKSSLPEAVACMNRGFRASGHSNHSNPDLSRPKECLRLIPRQVKEAFAGESPEHLPGERHHAASATPSMSTAGMA